MASAKLVNAMATGKIKIQKAPRISGEVSLIFRPLLNRTTGKTEQPKTITIGFTPIEPLRRSSVTLEHLKHSNLEALVRRQAIKIV